MSRNVVYVQKEGTLESFCVFEGDILLERTDMSPVTKEEHESLTKQRANVGKAHRQAKDEGYVNAEQKADEEKRVKAEDKEAKAVVAQKKKAKVKAPKKPVEKKAAPAPKKKKAVKAKVKAPAKKKKGKGKK